MWQVASARLFVCWFVCVWAQAVHVWGARAGRLERGTARAFSPRRRGVLERWVWWHSWRFYPQTHSTQSGQMAGPQEGLGAFGFARRPWERLWLTSPAQGSLCDWIKLHWKKWEITANKSSGVKALKRVPAFFSDSSREEKKMEWDLYFFSFSLKTNKHHSFVCVCVCVSEWKKETGWMGSFWLLEISLSS